MGHRGVKYQGNCSHLPMHPVAADPHSHATYSQLPQILADLAPPGEVFVALHDPYAATHCEDESPECVAVGEALNVVAIGQVLEVVALGYTNSSAGIIQVV